MIETKATQAQLVLDYMKEFGSITPLEAIQDLGVYRLSARISDLKKKGFAIQTKMEKVPNRRQKTSKIARYSLAEGNR